MRLVIQRVSRGSVSVGGSCTGKIGKGLLIFMGIEDRDTPEDIAWLSGKVVNLRIFKDADGVMNCSVQDTGGDILLISQFTLHASTKKGNRPSYSKASNLAYALPLYEAMISRLQTDLGKKIETGIFGANMQVELLNDGPVTILMDSQNRE